MIGYIFTTLSAVFLAGSPGVSASALRQTEVFFLPDTGPADGGPMDQAAARDPIVITQNVDSVTSSIMSAMSGLAVGDHGHSDDDNSDDFCMIDDAAWAKAVSLL